MIIIKRRIIANLLSILASVYFVVTRMNQNQDSFIFLVFSLPYILSNSAVTLMLILSTFRKPKDVNDKDKMFLVSVLGCNLSIIVGLLGADIIGNPILPQVSIYAACASVLVVPFYIAAVISLGKSLTVLPEANKLKTHGIYRISRHPLYLCYIIWYILQVLISQSWIIVLASMIQAALQIMRAKGEEEILEKNFPEYNDYRKKVGWFLGLGARRV